MLLLRFGFWSAADFRGEGMMVKGISKRVIIVKTPVNNLFDQAIFILNDSALNTSPVNAENILREACAVADEYVRRHCGKRRRLKRSKTTLLISCGVGALALSALIFSFFI